MAGTETVGGRVALTIGHVVGMIDMVALPVWVGDLIQNYKFSPSQAGGLVTLFLIGVLGSSLLVAPRFQSINGRLAAAAGFAGTGVAFYLLAQTSNYPLMAALHLVGGAFNGVALSFAHGTIGRTANPHRLMAIAQTLLGVVALVFLGAAPNVIAAQGGPSLFLIFAAMMAFAALASALIFPAVSAATDAIRVASSRPFGAAVWFMIGGVMLMALNQAMMFSFVERIGIDRGFGADRVTGVLIALGAINLLPGALAGFLQNRIPARSVLLAGPILQAIFAVVITNATQFPVYAVPTALYVFIMIFTHTFAFGTIARLEPTGRALASTPAMLMTGSAIGPFLGGVLAQFVGYPALGVAVVILGSLSCASFLMASRAPGFAPSRAAAAGVAA
jgi:predicted MFS family arabinose efflux permease